MLVIFKPLHLNINVTMAHHNNSIVHVCLAVIHENFRHLGSHRNLYTPTKRGFQSHVGYWTGHEDYYDHTAQELYQPVVRFNV